MITLPRLLLLLGCFLSLSDAYTTSSSIKSALWKQSNEGLNRQDCGSLLSLATTPKSVVALRAGASSPDPAIGTHKLMKELLAEFIGTFLLVQIGCGSVMSDMFAGAAFGLFPIAVVWAVAVTIAIATTANVSGAHLNPSITIAMALFREFQWRKVIPYAMAQTMGASAAAGVNLVLFAGQIKAFEQANGIVRGTAASVVSARVFGEYIS